MQRYEVSATSSAQAKPKTKTTKKVSKTRSTKEKESPQRRHILDTTLSLMAQNGVDGTSMRDLADATGLNVATLYHYFPSKRDLLIAVLEERGYISELAASPGSSAQRDPTDVLTELLRTILSSMLDVEDFVRLMLGEVLRGDTTAHVVGAGLFATFQEFLERWLSETRPDLNDSDLTSATAHLLRSMLIGVFFEYLAGVIDEEDGVAATFELRALEAANLLRPRGSLPQPAPSLPASAQSRSAQSLKSAQSRSAQSKSAPPLKSAVKHKKRIQDQGQ